MGNKKENSMDRSAASSTPTGSRQEKNQPELYAPLAVIGKVVPNLLAKVSPGDAPIILYHTTAITTAWFDAIAPYSKKTAGIHSNLPKYRADGSLNDERSISILYASARVLNALMPEYRKEWRNLLKEFGLDPSDKSRDTSSPIGIGNKAGAKTIAALKTDGMNFRGKAINNDGTASGRPFADTTGYKPVNTINALNDPRRWQPDTISNSKGELVSQTFATPQWSTARPYSYDKPVIIAPTPRASYAINNDGTARNPYIRQAEKVIQAQLNLTDQKKLLAEFFDDKIASLGLSTVAAALHHGLSLKEFVELDALVNIAAYDTGITLWDNKIKYDSVRPITAIRYLNEQGKLTGDKKDNKNTVDQITGRDWEPYLQTANHAEYPSGTAGFAAAHTRATRRYLIEVIGLNKREANDLSFWKPDLGITGSPLHIAAGGSRIEPGRTPSRAETLRWNTWHEFSAEAGRSRVWAGVHFPASIGAAQTIGRNIGKTASDWLIARIHGHAS